MEKRRQILFRLSDQQSRTLFSFLSYQGLRLQHVFETVSDMLIEYKTRRRIMDPLERDMIFGLIKKSENRRLKNKI